MMNANLKQADVREESRVEGMQHWLDEVKSAAEVRAEKLREQGQRLLDVTSRKAQQAQDAARRAGREMTESADDFVREKPWQAIAISAGAGALLGWLLSRRK